MKKIDTETLQCIKDYIIEHKYPPSFREMAKMLNISSTSSVERRVKRLIDIGVLESDSPIGSSRAIRIKGTQITLPDILKEEN